MFFPETKTFAQNPGFNEDIIEYFGNNDLILIAEAYFQNLFYKDVYKDQVKVRIVDPVRFSCTDLV